MKVGRGGGRSCGRGQHGPAPGPGADGEAPARGLVLLLLQAWMGSSAWPSSGLSFTSMKEDAPLAPDQDLQGHLTWALSPNDSEVVDEMGIEKTKVFEELAPMRGWMQHLPLGLITNKRGVSKCWRPQAS